MRSAGLLRDGEKTSPSTVTDGVIDRRHGRHVVVDDTVQDRVEHRAWTCTQELWTLLRLQPDVMERCLPVTNGDDKV